MDAQSQHSDDGKLTYRLEVEGRIGDRWSDWFEADVVRSEGASTVLELRVADQSELYGRLRRIHDLNLRLISVTRTDRDQH